MSKILIALLLWLPLISLGQKVTEADLQSIIKLSKQGHTQEALARMDSIRKVVTIKDQNYLLLLMTGAELNMTLFNWEAAVAIQEELIPLVPDKEEDIQLYIGRLKKDLGDFDGAITAYLRVLQLNPKEEIVYNNLANAYNSAGKFLEAIRTLNSNPASDRLSLEYRHYAVAYLNLNKLDSAKFYIDKYLLTEEAATDFIAYKTAAHIYLALNDTQKACQFLCKASDILETTHQQAELDKQPEKLKNTYFIKYAYKQIEEVRTMKPKVCS